MPSATTAQKRDSGDRARRGQFVGDIAVKGTDKQGHVFVILPDHPGRRGHCEMQFQIDDEIIGLRKFGVYLPPLTPQAARADT